MLHVFSYYINLERYDAITHLHHEPTFKLKFR